MKSKKLFSLLITVLMAIMMAISAFAFTACDSGDGSGDGGTNTGDTDNGDDDDDGGDDDGGDTDKHNWSKVWDYDGEYHWHNCLDEDCSEKTTPEKHTVESGKCTVCDYEEEVKEEEGDLKFTTCIVTSAGQTTKSLQRVFKVGDAFNYENLTVYDKTSGDKLDEGAYTVALKEGDDMTTAGEKTVEIISGELKSTYKIFVLDLSGVSTTGEASVTVKSTATVGVSGNTVTVKSINDALKVYELLGLGANIKKVIKVENGNYYEKVYINIPNLKLIGVSDRKVGAGESGNNGAVIWYDNLAGEKDSTGASNIGTFTSYSVRVGTSATGFEARNITFKNKYNTHELYTQSESYLNEKFGNKDTQAVALRVDSGEAEFYNCKMTGYHDTLHIEGGNHYYEQCWIEGHTDYIFGNNSNTYFYKCNIYSIGSGNAANGGYVVANRPATTDYNCVFNECNFDADANTVDGTVALGRPWGANMKMTVIYSTLSGKYSKKAHTAGNNNGDRYCTMSGVDPNPELMLEYGNEGDGAITASLANTCTYLTKEQAAAYKLDKIEDILGFVPGEGDAKKLYDFSTHPAVNGTGTTANPGLLFDGDIEVVGGYRVYYTGSHFYALNIYKDAVITLKVAGKVTIGWFGGGYGSSDDAEINYKNGYATIKIVRQDNNCHINNIIVNTARTGEHVHVYGEWSVNPVPTTETTGTATRTCTDCELATPHAQTVTLPVLSEENYKLGTGSTADKVKYTYTSEYGDISFEAEPLAGVHVHNYGPWEVKPENIPTNDKVGAVTRTCTDGDCNHDENATQSKELPVLTDSRYKITDNTATAQSEGEGTYTITIDGIDEPVSFTAETPRLTTTTFNFGDYAASAKPSSFFDGNITVNSSGYWLHGQAIRLNAGDTVVVNVKGAVSLVWWGGNLGTEANGKISYKGGYATIAIVNDAASTGGIYLKSITVDHTDEPADTKYTVTFNSKGGSAVASEQVVAYDKVTKPADPTKEGYTFQGWYKDEGCLDKFDFNTPITEDIELFASWKSNSVVTHNITVKVWEVEEGTLPVEDGTNLTAEAVDALLAAKGYKNCHAVIYSDETLTTPYTEAVTADGTVYVKVVYDVSGKIDLLEYDGVQLEGSVGYWRGIKINAASGKFCPPNNQWCQFNTGTVLSFYTVVGTKATITEMQGTHTFAVDENGLATITSGGGYIRDFTLNVPKTFNFGDSVDMIGCKINIQAGASTEYAGLSITAGTDKFQDNTSYIHVGAGSTISFKVASGVTAENLQIVFTNHQDNENSYQQGNHFTVTVEDGVATITVGNGTMYIKSFRLAQKV